MVGTKSSTDTLSEGVFYSLTTQRPLTTNYRYLGLSLKGKGSEGFLYIFPRAGCGGWMRLGWMNG